MSLNPRFAYWDGEMDAKWDTAHRKCPNRWPTFKAALTLASQKCLQDPLMIIETGCQREAEDWGAGMSTSLFSEFLSGKFGRLIVIDNNGEHLERAKRLVPGADDVVWCRKDSVEWLGSISNNPEVNLLYLDSFDYPIDPSKPTYAAEVIASQEHCLREVRAAAKSGVLSDRTVLLIDDCMEGGGKPGLAKEWLIANGWTLVLELAQTLWVKI